MTQDQLKKYLLSNLGILADLEEVHGHKLLIIRLVLEGNEINHTNIWI